MEAIHLLKKLEEENRLATPKEQEVLSRYVGWGGIPNAFDKENSDWVDAYSGSETDPSEAFSGRRPRREDTGPSGSVPGSRPPSILNHGFFGVPWSKRCNMGAFR